MSAPLLFLACCRDDANICAELEKHLVPLRRNGMLRFASSRSLGFERWAVRHTITEAHTVAFVLTPAYLISPDFSDDMSSVDTSVAAPITILAGAIEPSLGSRWLPEGKADLPRNGKAITCWPDRDEALADVVDGLLRAVVPQAPSAAMRAPWTRTVKTGQVNCVVTVGDHALRVRRTDNSAPTEEEHRAALAEALGMAVKESRSAEAKLAYLQLSDTERRALHALAKSR